jgi:hypothetical protein
VAREKGKQGKLDCTIITTAHLEMHELHSSHMLQNKDFNALIMPPITVVNATEIHQKQKFI